MITTATVRAAACRALLSAAVVALSGAALAGTCPADKLVADGQKPGAAMPKGVEDKVLAAIDLAQEAPRLGEHKLRLRRLVIQPGGVVPWHSHGERPAIIYIVSGTITEYASTCAVPIRHKAGEVAPETHATSHWWRNTGKAAVVLLSADILHDKADATMM